MGGSCRKNGARQFRWRREKMQFDYSNSKNDPKQKRYERLNSNKKKVKNGIKNVRPHIVSIPDEKVLF